MNNNQNSKQSPQAPQWLLKKARERQAYTQQEMKQAKARIAPEYHDFLVMLPQNEKLTDNAYSVDRNGAELGMYSYNGGTYMSIEKPYVTVDGRVQMIRDEHAAAGKKFNIHPPQIFNIGDTVVMSITVDSEIYGSATGVIEVGLGGRGVDSKNPIANAQTSAIGRALGFLGYGLVGTGVIASPEEMAGLIDQPEQQQPAQQAPNRPTNWRVQVIGNVQHNPDGSSTCAAKTEQQQTIQVVFTAAQKQFVQQLQPNHIINVVGWFNEKKSRLVVADNSQSVIENATA